MKEIVVRAIIRTETVFNEGYLHINGEIIEGIFTLDYVRINLDGKEMFLTLIERSIYYDEMNNLIHKCTFNYYKQRYSHNYLYSPDTYSLCDETGSLLTISLEEPIKDSDEISQILKDINYVRI